MFKTEKVNYYEEKQQFKANYIFLLLIPSMLLPMILLAKEDRWLLGLGIVVGTLVLTGGLFYLMQQTIRIDANGIHFKQLMIHRKYRTIAWTDIKDWKITKMNALGDFGGWGYRVTGKKWGYIIEGDFGLELETDAKKITVLSIKNRVEAERYIASFYKTNSSISLK